MLKRSQCDENPGNKTKVSIVNKLAKNLTIIGPDECRKDEILEHLANAL